MGLDAEMDLKQCSRETDEGTGREIDAALERVRKSAASVRRRLEWVTDTHLCCVCTLVIDTGPGKPAGFSRVFPRVRVRVWLSGPGQIPVPAIPVAIPVR